MTCSTCYIIKNTLAIMQKYRIVNKKKLWRQIDSVDKTSGKTHCVDSERQTEHEYC